MSAEQSAPTQSEGTSDAAVRGPLFRFDPGWPFVIAGLALIVSAVLIPAQRELHDLEQRLKVHQAFEERSKAEILAYEQFQHDITAGNERLLERLVRAQLNKMPKDERPLLLMPTANDTVPQWIESSVAVEIPEPTPYPDTLLSRIASGPRRLWVLATGAFLVFLGVMFAPTTFSARRPRGARIAAQPVGCGVGTAGEGVVELASVAGAGAVAVAAAEAVADASAESSLDAVEEVVPEEVSATTGPIEPEVIAGEVPAAVAVAEAASEAVEATEPLAEVELAAESVDAQPEEEAAVCEIETMPVAVPAPVAHEPETLDSALHAAETHEAQDVHELQYASLECDEPGAEELECEDASDEDADELESNVPDLHPDAGEEVARAETEAIPGEPECAIEVGFDARVPAEPSASDRALDRLSLFDGIHEDRWIDTTDRAAR